MARSDPVRPESFKRRSFIHHKLKSLGARFGALGDGAVVTDYGTGDDEADQARYLALADLSPLPRIGFKGPGVIDWLSEQGVEPPAQSNRATAQADGALVARLGPSEFLVLDDLGCESRTVARLQHAWQSGKTTPDSSLAFTAPRQDSHAWFGLAGSRAAAVLAKLCAVDLRPMAFDNASVAQTSAARLGVIIIRCDLGSNLHYHLLVDSAASGYFWNCLLDAMAEHNGKPVGLSALRGLE